MKRALLIFGFCLLLVLQATAQTQGQKTAKAVKPVDKKISKTTETKAGKTNDVELIKNVIEAETKAYFGIDYKTWMESWMHTPSAYWSFADSTGITSFEGWKAIEIGFNDYFVTSKPSDTYVERQWQEVKVYGNGAYARFKQRVVSNGVVGPEQSEIRVLEKDKDKWKILLVGVLKKSI